MSATLPKLLFGVVDLNALSCRFPNFLNAPFCEVGLDAFAEVYCLDLSICKKKTYFSLSYECQSGSWPPGGLLLFS